MKAQGIRAVLIEKGLEGAIIFLANLFEERRDRVDKPDARNEPLPSVDDLVLANKHATTETQPSPSPADAPPKEGK